MAIDQTPPNATALKTGARLLLPSRLPDLAGSSSWRTALDSLQGLGEDVGCLQEILNYVNDFVDDLGGWRVSSLGCRASGFQGCPQYFTIRSSDKSFCLKRLQPALKSSQAAHLLRHADIENGTSAHNGEFAAVIRKGGIDPSKQ